jgi:large subunit ribosomal protein L13
MERQTHTIDATDRPLGRLATEVAILLRGKQKENFVLNQDIGDFIVIKNFSKIKFTGKKIQQKKYYHHSGYLGGLKEKPLDKLFEENPTEIMIKAVWGMLPKNKLRKEQIKRLKIEL